VCYGQLLHKRLHEVAQWEVSFSAFLSKYYGHERQGVEGTDENGLDLCGSGWRPVAGFRVNSNETAGCIHDKLFPTT
jgi:hypothetical protein